MSNTFAFFDLPPELRNITYRMLSRQRSTAAPGSAEKPPVSSRVFYAGVIGYVDPPLLQVSKQFKAELEREIYQQASLYLEAKLSYCSFLKLCPSPHTLVRVSASVKANVQHVELNIRLSLDWPLDVSVLEEERSAILRSACMRQLRTLTIRFHIPAGSLRHRRNFDMEDQVETEVKASNMVRELYDSAQDLGDIAERVLESTDVDAGLFIRDKLYSTCLPELTSSNGWLHAPLSDMNDDIENYVCFRAEPSNSRCAYYGMDLEMEDCGYFDVERHDRLLKEGLMKQRDALVRCGVV